MEKKVLKIFLVISMVLLIIFVISERTVVDATYNVKNFSGEKPSDGVAQVQNLLGGILFVVRIVGAGVGLIMLTVLGAKYMLASAGEKAEVKKHATTYVIGAVVMIAASGILGIIQNFVTTSTTIN